MFDIIPGRKHVSFPKPPNLLHSKPKKNVVEWLVTHTKNDTIISTLDTKSFMLMSQEVHVHELAHISQHTHGVSALYVYPSKELNKNCLLQMSLLDIIILFHSKLCMLYDNSFN